MIESLAGKKDTFGERLKKMRIKQGYTQAQLATFLEITTQTVSNYEQGRVSYPACDYLLKMARVLDCAPEYLLNGETEMNAYTNAVIMELKQMTNPTWIKEVHDMDYTEKTIEHLELGEEIITSLTTHWNSRGIFDQYCTRPYVCEVLLHYAQNRRKLIIKYGLKDYFLAMAES